LEQRDPVRIVQTAFDNSFCIGVVLRDTLIGFARLITDYATFAYLADVFVLEDHRGKGLSKQMMKQLMSLDWVRQLRGIKLQTKDAHDLYRQFGFADCKHPERILEVSRPDIYTTS
jgi:GNAT superfamily N-acetyltransferase